MTRETRYTGMMGDWQRLHARIDARKAELPQLEPYLTKLKTILDRAVEVARQQGAMQAAKQEATQEMRQLASQGNRVTALMRQALREHYGVGEEKLSEFGLQPFRGRKRRKPTPPEPATPDAPPPASPDPVQPIES